MKKNVLISVIVPIYNSEKYLNECINSILAQTYKNIEIILVNDGSTDGSYSICNEWKKKDKRIKIVNKTNGGVVSARKIGVQVAEGQYISYIDSDDWIEAEMYEKMADSGFAKNADIISVEDIREYANGTTEIEQILLREGYYNRTQVENDILSNLIDTSMFFTTNIPMHGWQHLFKRELVQNNHTKVDDRIKCGEDMLSALWCYLEANSIVLLKQPLYHYRQVPKSARSTSGEKNIDGLCLLNKSLDEICRKSRINKKIMQEQLRFYMFYTIFWSAYEVCLSNRDDILFPYDVPRNSKIVLIGAGNFGSRVYRKIKELGFCDIIVWADTRWQEYYKLGKNVKGIDDIDKSNYDYIVLAILNTQMQGDLINSLKEKGIEENRIKTVKKELLSEEKLSQIINEFENGIK